MMLMLMDKGTLLHPLPDAVFLTLLPLLPQRTSPNLTNIWRYFEGDSNHEESDVQLLCPLDGHEAAEEKTAVGCVARRSIYIYVH